MNRFTKKLLAVVVLVSVVVEAWADKGVGKRIKNKTNLNITVPANVKSSLAFNMKSGLSYKGSLLNTRVPVGNSLMMNSLITYHKGNTTYIVPYKTKITMPEVKPGYTGMKVIIRKK